MTTWTDEHLKLIRELMIRMTKADLEGFKSMLESERACSRVSEVDTKGQFINILAEITPIRGMGNESVLSIFQDWVVSMQETVRDEIVEIVQSTMNELEGMARDQYVEDIIAMAKEQGWEQKITELGEMERQTILSLTSDLQIPNKGSVEDSGTG